MDSSGIHPRMAISSTAGNRPATEQSGSTAPTGKSLPADGRNLPAAPAAEPTHEQLQQAVQQIQSYLNDSRRQLQFQIDDGSGRTVVRVVNPETHELIRQIPSEEVLTLSRAISGNAGGLISDLA